MKTTETEAALARDYPDISRAEIIRAATAIDRTGLSYEDRHVYATPRMQGGRQVLVVFAGIDGLRLAATATGCYAGCVRHDPEFGVDNDGLMFPKSIRATCRRRLETGEIAEFSTQAFLAEYENRTKAPDGGLWVTKPVTMLGKVAESQAIRMAFPDRFSQVYEPGEFPSDHGPAPEPTRTLSTPTPAPARREQPPQADLPLSPVGTEQVAWWDALPLAEWERIRSSSVKLSRWRQDDREKPALPWMGIAPAMRLEILAIAADGGFGPQADDIPGGPGEIGPGGTVLP